MSSYETFVCDRCGRKKERPTQNDYGRMDLWQGTATFIGSLHLCYDCLREFLSFLRKGPFRQGKLTLRILEEEP